MFPERQQGPHREWRAEVEYLDNIFGDKRGAAYTVGKVNGDHWLLYLANPGDDGDSANNSDVEADVDTPAIPDALEKDYTLEILMTKLSSDARSAFFFPTTDSDSVASAQSQAGIVSHTLGIDSLFPASMTTLDAFAFTPCGYSANALLRPASGPDGYYTIHVTPEEGWSFASFECNIPLSHYTTSPTAIKTLPDLRTLIQRVVQIFQPGHLSLTLFVTSPDDPPSLSGAANGLVNGNSQHAMVEAPVDSAHRAFKEALAPKGYKRTDKINYEFGGYDLAFASFEAR
jgi:S-adenosylmethionine decarboxylase